MLKNEDYELLLHEIKNTVAVISCSLQLIEKQHPEVSDYPFWEDTSEDLTNLRALLIKVASLNLHGNPNETNIKVADLLRDIRAK